MQHLKHAEEAVDLKFGLGVAGFMLTPGDGADARGAAVPVETVLKEGPIYPANGQVDCEVADMAS